jgi:cation:H+ antiporter
MVDIVILIASLGVILLGAELFTNGIEWFGHRLNLAEGAVGSVLAAVATAMPETLIPVIAIIGPALAGHAPGTSAEIGVGAILGAPFMLATLAMFVTGVAVLAFSRSRGRSIEMRVNVSILGRDVGVFVVAYAVAIGTAFLPEALSPLRWVIVAGLLVIYATYVRAHFADESEVGDSAELNRLHAARVPGLGRGSNDAAQMPRLRIIVGQVIVALAAIIIGAQIFVGAVEHASTLIGMDPRILALIVAPIATELPEKFNSVLWVRHGKDTLAMGNITGAMVFQSCLPTVLGIGFTDWRFGAASALAFASAGAAFVSTVLIFGVMRARGRLDAWTLLIGGPIYLCYLLAAILLPVPAASLA